MILSYQHRFLFLKTRKTAGTSIELALSPLAGKNAIVTRVTAEDEAKRAEGDRPRNFVFDRKAPEKKDRVYFNHIRAPVVRERIGEEVWSDVFKFSIERNPWDRQVSRYHWWLRKRPKVVSFDDYLERERSKLDNFDIYSIGGKIVADFVIRYERLNEDFAAVGERIGLNAALPKSKSSYRPAARPHYSTYYTSPRTRQLIEEWYPREIEAFGYRFETE